MMLHECAASFTTVSKYYDTAVIALLKILKIFLKCIGVAFDCQWAERVRETIPQCTSAMKRAAVGVDFGNFHQYIVCTKCHSLYNYNDCIELINGKETPKKCRHKEYPNHPQQQHHKECGESLLKYVKKRNGQMKLVLRKVYCYSPLIHFLYKAITQSPWNN